MARTRHTTHHSTHHGKDAAMLALLAVGAALSLFVAKGAADVVVYAGSFLLG
jgi:hypothetical protein